VKKKRGMTLPEIMIGSTLLLLLIGITSMAVVSYFRAYRQYTDKGLRIRLTAKSLESLAGRLRAAQVIYSPDQVKLEAGIDLGSQSLVFLDDDHQMETLAKRGPNVTLSVGNQRVLAITEVETLHLRELGTYRQRRLELSLKEAAVSFPIDTAIGWMNVVHNPGSAP
jgi:prepilin-type N-terminal cleavage/methylation domain-containing protein